MTFPALTLFPKLWLTLSYSIIINRFEFNFKPSFYSPIHFHSVNIIKKTIIIFTTLSFFCLNKPLWNFRVNIVRRNKNLSSFPVLFQLEILHNPKVISFFFKRMTKKVISVFVRSYIYSIFKAIVQFEFNSQTSLRRIYFVKSQIDESPKWRIVNWIAETLIFQTVDLAHSEICLVLGANPRQCPWCHVLSRMSWVNSLHRNFNNKMRKKGTNIFIIAKFWNNHDNGMAYVTFIQISKKYVLILLQLAG